jgi:hypothetical protein
LDELVESTGYETEWITREVRELFDPRLNISLRHCMLAVPRFQGELDKAPVESLAKGTSLIPQHETEVMLYKTSTGFSYNYC